MAVYGTAAGALLEDSQSSESDDSDQEGNRLPRSRSASGRVIDRDVLDRVAWDTLGMQNFSHKLKRVMKMEGETDALKELKSTKYAAPVHLKDSIS